MHNLIKRSSLMSGAEAKERAQVFKKLRRKVQAKLDAMDV
jgi:hypothetical protein